MVYITIHVLRQLNDYGPHKLCYLLKKNPIIVNKWRIFFLVQKEDHHIPIVLSHISIFADIEPYILCGGATGALFLVRIEYIFDYLPV